MLRVEGNSASVLIIDPSAHMRRLVATLMSALDIRGCAEARGIVQAGPQVMKHQPDLIVLDLGGDATEALLFVHRLRRGEFGERSAPVLGISPSTHHAMLELAWEAGINDVVGKPISAIEVIQRAGALLAERGKRSGQSRSAAE